MAVITLSLAEITFFKQKAAILYFVIFRYFLYNIITFLLNIALILLHVNYLNAETSKMHKIAYLKKQIAAILCEIS